MSEKLKFCEGEKVLCVHGPLIYVAKCLKTTISKDKKPKYFLHYAGWNKNWDEWVPETRILKYNEANLIKQKEVQKAYETQPNKSKKLKLHRVETETKDSDSTSSTLAIEPTKPGKRKLPSTLSSSADADLDVPKNKRSPGECEEQLLNKVEVMIQIPDELKPWLVDDWDCILRQRKLVNLPAKMTVAVILEHYLIYKKSCESMNTDQESDIDEMVTGIRDYFNVMLGTQLLYKFERPQYREMLQNYPGTPRCNIYGAVHLLRLFVKFGPLIAYTPLEEQNVMLLVQKVQDFLKYLAKNSTTLFNLNQYCNSTPEYHRRVL